MNIIELAREAGFTELEFFGNKVGTNVTECLERFADQVLEAAAVECDKRAHAGDAGALMAARAIRALKGAKE